MTAAPCLWSELCRMSLQIVYLGFVTYVPVWPPQD